MRPTVRFLALPLAAALALGLVAACRSTEPPADPNALVIRTYSVPGNAKELQRSVAGILEDDGTARSLSDDTLVVTAPVSLHEGIAELVAAAAADPGASGAASPTVAFDYWAIVARPAATAATDALRSPALSDALAEVTGVHGPLEFAVVDTARLSSTADGGPAGISGRRLGVRQRVVTVKDDTVVADLELQVQNEMRPLRNGLETRVRLSPGDVVVLGQAAYDTANGWLPDGWRAADDVMLFYVVTASID